MSDLYISIAQTDWEVAKSRLLTPDGKENAGVFYCASSKHEKEHRLLVRRFRAVPQNLYDSRQHYHLQVSPEFYNTVISECEKDQLAPVIVHSHPHHQDAWYSKSDDFGESRLLPVLDSLLPGLTPASLVLTPSSVVGRKLRPDGGFVSLTGMKISGVKSKIINFAKANSPTLSNQYDRQVLAFGLEGQQVIQTLKAAVIGLGGIGSLVAEQLARLGVNDITLVDPDRIEVSNVSRVFGTDSKQVGKLKIETVGSHIAKLGVARVNLIAASAIRQEVLLMLRDRDIIFCCVDNDSARSILNRFAHQYLIPVVDHGTRIDARAAQVRAAAGRVTLFGAGLACARCSHHINPERIYAESLPTKERLALEKEGYVVGLTNAVPSVVSMNTVVAGLGVTAALNLFVDLTGGMQPVDQLYDATSGSVFAASAKHDTTCDICSETTGIKGLGDSQVISAYH